MQSTHLVSLFRFCCIITDMTLSEHSFCSLIRLNQAKNKLADAFTVFFIIRRITLLKCIVFLLLNGKIEVTGFFFWNCV